jgi:MATE family multidrug resistance protein
MIANGLVMGVDPLLSQAHGAGDPQSTALAFQRGLLVALGISFPLGALWLVTEPMLRICGQAPELARAAGDLALVQAPTAAGFLIFSVTRQYLGARGLGRAVIAIVAVANVINAILCFGLVFGRFGFPALGLTGAGISQGAARMFLGCGLLATTFGFGLHRGAWIPWSRAALDVRALFHIIRLGMPLGVQFGLEVWAFQISALLAGRLGTDALAANTIVLNFAALSFMIPLGLSMGASIRVGNLVGEGRSDLARRSARVSYGIAAFAMGLPALLFLVLRADLPRLFGATPAVLALSAAIFPIAAAFQLCDGVQVVGGGILRGLGRTRPGAVLNFIGYYLVALPLGYFLGIRLGWGLPGLWWGLASGLGVVAIGVLGLTLRAQDFAAVGRA